MYLKTCVDDNVVIMYSKIIQKNKADKIKSYMNGVYVSLRTGNKSITFHATKS